CARAPRETPLSDSFQASGLIGFPAIAAGALPIEVAGLEAAHLAGVTVEPLCMAVNDGAQQAEVGACSDFERRRGPGGCVRSLGLTGRGRVLQRAFFPGSQLDFKKAVEPQHGGVRTQGFAGERPRRPVPLRATNLAKHNVEDIQRRVSRVMLAQQLKTFSSLPQLA